MSGEPQLVDGADIAEGMTVEYGGRAYTIKGITGALEGGRRRNAYVHDAEGTPGAMPMYRGRAYPVLDDGQIEHEHEAGQ